MKLILEYIASTYPEWGTTSECVVLRAVVVRGAGLRGRQRTHEHTAELVCVRAFGVPEEEEEEGGVRK